MDDDIICAIENFNHIISYAPIWSTTPICSSPNISIEYLPAIKHKLAEKRKLHKLWQIDRCPALKTKLNRVIKAFKNLLELERNQGIQRYLSELSLIITNYSLWKPRG